MSLPNPHFSPPVKKKVQGAFEELILKKMYIVEK